mgnify:CR=1 FL=1
MHSSTTLEYITVLEYTTKFSTVDLQLYTSAKFSLFSGEIFIAIFIVIFILLSWLKRNLGRCQAPSSGGPSKIKIRTSPWHKADLALCHGEVRILIFDDPAELEA